VSIFVVLSSARCWNNVADARCLTFFSFCGRDKGRIKSCLGYESLYAQVRIPAKKRLAHLWLSDSGRYSSDLTYESQVNQLDVQGKR